MIFSYLLVFISALCFGFMARKVGICLVAAVAEILMEKKIKRLISILSASIWGIFALWLLGCLGYSIFAFHYDFHLLSLLGGFLFGFGAGLNMGCNISTLNKLCTGQIVMMATIVGWGIGFSLFILSPILHPVALRQINAVALMPQNLLSFLCAFLWLLLWVVVWKKGANPQHSFLQKIKAPQYRGMSAAIIIGFLTAVLTYFIADWSPTTQFFSYIQIVLKQQSSQEFSLLSIFPTFALLAGMVLASFHSKAFKITKAPLKSWLRHGFAGIMMGLGAAMIPGGNDALIFIALPILSPHAPLAFLMILLGIMGALIFAKMTKINCQSC